MAGDTDFYDALGANYDLLIDWEARLGREGPFYQRLFGEYEVNTVLDMACGTGQHAALFREWGLDVVGCDPSREMMAACESSFGDLGIEFLPVGFGEIGARIGRSFDAITCLGNSYPHLLTESAAQQALDDFHASLSPGGVLVLQTLNYAQMIADNERFMPPSSGAREGRELIFLRVLDFGAELVGFSMVTLVKEHGKWRHHVETTRHRPTFRPELEQQLRTAGFSETNFHGGFDGSAYEDRTSDHLLAVAKQ
ncbi:MAG: methyltransferase domain-containing protein [Armatimonadota bacterium]|jgi:SAM-dependent methyltransferase